MAHPSPSAPETLTPIQRIVGAYKIAKGIDRDDKAWDKGNFARAAKAAKTLLENLGAVEKCVAYVLCKAEEFKAGNFTWTLETIVRHGLDQKGEINAIATGDIKQEALGDDPIPEPGRIGAPTRKRALSWGNVAAGMVGGLAKGLPETKQGDPVLDRGDGRSDEEGQA